MMQQIAVINDLSGFGKCSLTAAIPVLSSLGLSCHPLATAVLTGQTGYDHYYCRDLTDMIPIYTDMWKQNNVKFSGIYTGFLTGQEQISHVLDFIHTFREKDTFLLVDPVMGDDGKVYTTYSDELLTGMKELYSMADMVTPNLMEACLLTDTDYHEVTNASSEDELTSRVITLGRKIRHTGNPDKEVIITGVKHRFLGQPVVMTIAITDDTNATVHRTPYMQQSFSGTGDLFASAMCGLHMTRPELSTADALALVCSFLCEGIRDAVEMGSPSADGIPFEKHLSLLNFNYHKGAS